MTANGNGRPKPASAFKRKRIKTPSGRTELRTVRPGFRSVLDDIVSGRAGALLAEDLDRACRDPRDLEDLIDACAERGASARSLSGSLILTSGGTDAEVTMARFMVAQGNKSSRDTARRVAGGRERTAEEGRYGGGRRPFGFMPDPDATKHAKTLLLVETEAAELRAAATAILAGVSLRALARDLRDRGVTSVTGAKWTPDTLRGCLLKPAVAGVAVHTSTVQTPDGPTRVTTEHKASWEPILPQEQWQAVKDKLTDPDRTTRPKGSEPRWLVSNIAVCHCGARVTVRSSGGRPSYVCRGPSQHLRRSAVHVDEHVAEYIVARLSLPDAADLLRPPARPGIDTAALRAEAVRLGERRKALLRDLDDEDMPIMLAEVKRRLAKVTEQLTESTEPDPLAEFRDQPDAGQVWGKLPLPRRRAIVKLLCTVELLPSLNADGTKRRGRGFDPDSVRVLPVNGN